MVVMVNGEYTYQYKCCKELFLIRGDRVDLLIYVSHLLGDHEMSGTRSMAVKYWVDLHLRSRHFPARPFICIARDGTCAMRLEESSSILEGGLMCGARHDRDRTKPGEVEEGAIGVW